MIHAVILASIINSAYLAGVPALTDIYSSGLPIREGVEGWTVPEFITLTKLEVCMFIPYNTLAFSFVPPRVRPLTHAMVSATFNVAVSAVTLGYWDAQVRGAALRPPELAPVRVLRFPRKIMRRRGKMQSRRAG